MGCTSSKEATRKRSARESWYAPVSRSTSAPIHYIADDEAETCYSPSTPYSFTEEGTRVGQHDKSFSNKISLAAMLQQEELEYAESKGDYVAVYRSNGRDHHGYDYEPRKRVAVSRTHLRFNSSLIPVAEASECDNGDVDNINTWEFMNGLNDGNNNAIHRKSPLIRPNRRHTVFEKSLSFNKVQGLDSCFTELNTPVWQSHFSEQEKEGGQELEEPASFEEVSVCTEEQVESNSTSPAKSPSKSPLRNAPKTSGRSPLWSPLKSPLRSPLVGSCSPLFDPSLLAKFEQAVDASNHDLFLGRAKEDTITTSSSSFYNHTQGSSETSLSRESPHSTLTETATTESGMPLCKKDVTSQWELDNFETRCPPKGEDKVVLYFTSLRGVRKTYEDCCVLRRILQGLGVRVDERDVWMHSKFREELTELLDNKRVQVPRVFIKGRYIGGAEEVCQLHEDGLLVGLMEGMPYFGTYRKACEGCMDMRFIPCPKCHGSCKLLDDADQFVRCSECNENGLILCPLCS